MKRREFLASSLAATAIGGLTCATARAQTSGAAASAKRQFFELRAYHLKNAEKLAGLHGFLEKAALPALNRLGIKPVGVFTEVEPKDPPVVFVLMPYDSCETFAYAPGHLNADPQYQQAGAAYLQAGKNDPSFERIDSWLLLAFAGMPRLELPNYCREGKPRLFELRTYESHSEVKALKKIEMFNSGEIDTMREVGLAPIFYGQALTGPNLPHLTYMTSGENADLHKQHWDAFGKHPTWNKLKNDPEYADTVSKITKWILKPAPYSQV
jgi:hypothetical protein